MYRVVKMSGKYYALQIDSVTDDQENIDVFVSGGELVILCEDLEELEDLYIFKEDIQIVE